ncbi:MAG: hypothetical protein JWL62_2930, partial [Hyphomicrobiales bacterium]|nr:hypothetical protein [Hyphomicrobiales bacterium]
MAQFSKLAWLLRGCKRRIGHLTQQPFLLFCGAMLIVLVIFGDALLISHLKEWAVRDGKQQTKHFSYVMAEETERTFEAVRSAAVGLTSRFEESGMSTTRE